MAKSANIFNSTETFGKRLQFVRKKAGISQAALATKLGYKTPGSVSNLESDKSPVGSETLAKLAEILEVDLHWLITGRTAPTNRQARQGYIKSLTLLNTHIGFTYAKFYEDYVKAVEVVERLESKQKKSQPLTDEEAEDLRFYTAQVPFLDHQMQQYLDEQNWATQTLNSVLKKQDNAT